MDDDIEIFCTHCNWFTRNTAISREAIIFSNDKEPFPIGFTYHCPKCFNTHVRCLNCTYTSGKANAISIAHFKNKHFYDCRRPITHAQEGEVDEFQNTSMDLFGEDEPVNMSIDLSTTNVVDDGSKDDDSDTSLHSFDQVYKHQIIDDDDDDDEDSDEEDSDDENDETPLSLNFEQHDIFERFHEIFGDVPCALYFFLNHLTMDDDVELPGGVRGLAHRSLNQLKFSLEMSEPELAGYYFDLMLKLQKETDEDKELTLQLIIGQLALMSPHLQGAKIPKLPLSMKEVNKYILTRRKSMLQNFPTEGVIDVDAIHACSSIEKLIDLMLAQGIRPDFAQNEYGVRNRSGINGTAASDSLVSELRANATRHNIDADSVAIGWISIWSDSFLSSWIKQKHNSVWVLTITVSNPSGRRSDDHTFIVAIGPSQVNHEDVIDNVIKQIKDLNKPKLRYCGHTNKFILTSFDVIAYLADRPERCHLTFTSLMGLWNKRFLWVGFCDRDYLPSCPKCFQRRLLESLGGIVESDEISTCATCADWDFSKPDLNAWKVPSSLSRVFAKHEKGPEAYPANNESPYLAEGRSIPESSHVRPKQQSFDWFIAAMKISFWMVATGKWFKYMFESFLRTFGINEASRERCFAAAKSAQNEIKGKSPAEQDSQLREMLNQPNLSQKGIIPRIWDCGVQLKQFICVPMHLLFTGVTSDLLSLVQKVMAKSRRKAKFNEEFTKIISEIMRYKLDWLKVKPLPATQFASENYVAIARLFPFLLGFYVSAFNPYGNGVTTRHVQLLTQVINSYSVMIASLMRSDDEVTASLLDRDIKLFLSCLNELEIAIDSWDAPDGNAGSGKKTKTKKKKGSNKEGEYSGIFNKGNFLSLLNIPSQFEFFGHLRLYWEGNNEFFISKIKSIVDHVRLSLSFFQGKLKQYQENSWLSFVNTQLSSDNTCNIVTRYHRYKSIQAVERAISKGTPISFIKFKDRDKLFVAVERSRGPSSSQKFIQLQRKRSEQTMNDIIIGAVYFHWEIVENSVIELQQDKLQKLLLQATCGILISFNSKYGHTAITENWKIIDAKGTFSFPRISKEVFDLDATDSLVT